MLLTGVKRCTGFQRSGIACHVLERFQRSDSFGGSALRFAVARVWNHDLRSLAISVWFRAVVNN